MQSSKLSIEGLLKSTYPLQIAARCTDQVEELCQKNSLSFVELLRPFSTVAGPYQLKDTHGHQYTVRNICAKFTTPNSEPVPDTKLRIDLGNCVKCQSSEAVERSGDTPWYQKYRNTFLDHLKQSDYECIKHYVCVVMVECSTVTDPVESFMKLSTAQKHSEQQKKYPKWLTPHLFYYYVLLHDLSAGGEARAKENYEKVEAAYGKSTCFFLKINSRAPGSPGKNVPDLWSHLLECGSETTDSDEVDGSLKFRLKKSKKSTKASLPAIPNNDHQKNPTVLVEKPDPNNAREEATLFTISNSDSDLSSQSQTVAPGNDPLTQQSTTIHHALSSADFSGSESSEKLIALNGPIEKNGGSGGTQKYGQCLKIEDHQRLAEFVQELVGRRLLPHLAEVLKILNEWLVSRRSVRRSFSSFSSKLVKMIQGPSNSTGDGPGYAANSGEIQLRQLADVAFIVQNFELAFQSYHHVKKDFQSASAWNYYAPAVEMCAVSAYMSSSTKREVVSYLEDAVSVYNLSCKAPYNALRCSLLLSEILKERGLFRELTQLSIRMTTEDDDLRSALCLEQAAYAFLRTQPSMKRKFALHLILAGHRYARSTQRVHSTRVYRQALEVYTNKGWTLAEDYIHFSLARHSFTLHLLDKAKTAFEALLSHKSLQSMAQQLLNLKEYIFVYKQLLTLELSSPLPIHPPTTTLSQASHLTHLPTLPVPFVNTHLTRVTFLTGATPMSLNKLYSLAGTNESNTSLGQYLITKQQQGGNSLSNLILGLSDYDQSKIKATKSNWEKLEVQAAAGVGGVLHENFRPSVLMMDESTDNTFKPVVVVNESVCVGLVLRNPLKIPLLMTNLALIWTHSPLGTSVSSFDASSTDEQPPEVSCEIVERVVLKPEEERMVTLHITPLKEGQLTVTGFLYNLCVDTETDTTSDSPLLSSQNRANLPSMAVNSQDVLYQKRNTSGVSEVMAAGLQGRVDVQIRGQRLNHTKEERAGVVYGADHRLSWTVAAPMPKIVACLTSLPTALTRGEVCRVGLEVYNCGQVPLNSLRVTSSLGGKLLFDKECSTSSGGVYPSTLLSPITVSPPPTSSQPHSLIPSHCVELPLPNGRLEPGGGVCAKLIMQGASSSIPQGWGEIPLNLLLYYEPALVSANSRLSHRVLRHSCMLKVNESLNLKSIAVHAQLPYQPSSSLDDTTTSPDKDRFDLNQVLVAVEAENRLSPGVAGEIRLTQISSVSSQWRLSKMDRTQGLLCLQPSESGVVQLKGTRLNTPSAELCYSDIPLGPTVIPSSDFPTVDLLRGDELPESEQSTNHVTLVVFWQALVPGGTDTQFSYGHQTVSVKLPQSMSTLGQTEPSSPYDIVKFHLEHPLTYRYPQTVEGLCQIPVRVVLQNCCVSNITTMVELLQPKDSSQQGEQKRSLEPTFFWSGGTCRRHISIQPNSTSFITVFANFGKRGVYNLNSLRVLVARGNGSYSAQRWQRTSYITIE